MSAGPHLDDDRLSALIDGEALSDDAAHVATCAECGALVAAWREASHMVSIPTDPPPATQRDAAVETALRISTPALGNPGAPPAPPSGRRQRARAFARLGPRFAAAAAAVIVIAGVAVAVSRTGGAGSAHTSNGPSVAGASAASTTAPAGSAASASGGHPPVAAAQPPRFDVVGGIQSSLSLVPALRAALGATQGASSETVPASAGRAAAFAPCLSRAAADARVPAGSTPLLEATLTYQGTPAEAFVFALGPGHVAAIVGVPACGLLTEVAF